MRTKTRRTRKFWTLIAFAVIDVLVLLGLVFVFFNGSDTSTLLNFLRGCNQEAQPPYCVLFNSGKAAEPTAFPTEVSAGTVAGGELIIINPNPVDDYLTNPGIGWQRDSDDVTSSYLPDTVVYSRRSRVSWAILNPSENMYDWAPLDAQLSFAAATGKQYSFRVYTMVGEGLGEDQIPEWVKEKGAVILPTGEPDYSNCAYQEEWSKFVEQLVARYDGNPDIAFIDISGYGNFNEWSWQDAQTEWDYSWEQSYAENNPSSAMFTTLDGQARRRLADMFIGGSFENHTCRDQNGVNQSLSYAYRGFQKTQLVMPFAGIVQSTQYVHWRRSDVGFRYDCLGRASDGINGKLDDILPDLWKTAPVVFEFCSPEQVNLDVAASDLARLHGSLVHNNTFPYDAASLRALMTDAGYRYFLKQAEIQVESGGGLRVAMDWQNVGYALSYPKMGQVFQLHLYLVNTSNRETIDYSLPADIASWLPAESVEAAPPENRIGLVLDLGHPFTFGEYAVKVAIIDTRTGKPIHLAFSEPDNDGRYFLTNIKISN